MHHLDYMVVNNPMAMRGDVDGELPLHYLCRHRDISFEKVQYMIQLYPRGVTIQSKTHGYLPLHIAAHNPYCALDIIELLIRWYPNSMIVSDYYGNIPSTTSLVLTLSSNDVTNFGWDERVPSSRSNRMIRRLSQTSLYQKTEYMIQNLNPDYLYLCNERTGQNVLHIACASTFRLTNKKLMQDILASSSSMTEMTRHPHAVYCHKGLLPLHYAILSIHDPCNTSIAQQYSDDIDDYDSDETSSRINYDRTEDNGWLHDNEKVFDSPLSRIQYLWKSSPFASMPLTQRSSNCQYQFHPVCLAASDSFYNMFCMTDDDDDDDDDGIDRSRKTDVMQVSDVENQISSNHIGNDINHHDVSLWNTSTDPSNIDHMRDTPNYHRRLSGSTLLQHHHHSSPLLKKTLSFISDKNCMTEQQDLMQLDVIYYLVQQSPELFIISRS
jgi:hypothetical protein